MAFVLCITTHNFDEPGEEKSNIRVVCGNLCSSNSFFYLALQDKISPFRRFALVLENGGVNIMKGPLSVIRNKPKKTAMRLELKGIKLECHFRCLEDLPRRIDSGHEIKVLVWKNLLSQFVL
jgi:hypothetical protein